MNKTLIKIFAIIGALAAAAALLYIFRDKVMAFCDTVKEKCSCKCNCNFSDFDEEEEEEAPIEAAPAEEAESEEAPAEAEEDIFAD